MGKKMTQMAVSATLPIAVFASVWLSPSALAGCAGGANEAIAQGIIWGLTAASVGFAATGVGAPIGFGFAVAAFALATADLVISNTMC